MTPRATPMSPEDRRAAILAAVVPLLAEQGGDVTTRQIAQAAGVAEGTIFRAFADKPALMLAAAQQVMDPETGRADLTAALADAPRLRDTVVRIVEHLVERMHLTMSVMLAVRGYVMSAPRHDERPGPPEFIVRANRDLVAMLTGILEPHRDELRVEPAVAAVLIRSVVFGSRHPGMEVEPHLDAELIADVVLGGVARETPREEAR